MASKKRNKTGGNDKTIIGFTFLEIAVFVFLLGFMAFPYLSSTIAIIGSPNATVQTTLQIGNVFPEIISVTVNGGAGSLDLTPNSTSTVTVEVLARDYNGEADIVNVSVEFFDNVASFLGDSDDNNYHYSNDTCIVDTDYGDIYEINATCTLPVWYYANSELWNASVTITDNSSLSAQGEDTITINALLALLLPDSIDYGLVNATEVSSEVLANVTNVGNVGLNLSLSGYAVTPGDNLAMNCTLGAIKNISLDYERYNLTTSTPGQLTLQTFQGNYTNLTSSPIIKEFNLPKRTDNAQQFVDDTQPSYWRIYVPLGVAGSCSGNIVFGAVQGPED